MGLTFNLVCPGEAVTRASPYGWMGQWSSEELGLKGKGFEEQPGPRGKVSLVSSLFCLLFMSLFSPKASYTLFCFSLTSSSRL